MQEAVATGAEVWVGDETTLREFPPLRAGWARRGTQATVLLTGRNPRRVVHTALNVRTGEVVIQVRERSRGVDVLTLIDALGQLRPTQPKFLIWDNAPPHKPKIVRAALDSAGITVGWLPFRAPELNPCEDLFLSLKGRIAANRVYDSVDTLAQHALDYLNDLGPAGRRHAASLDSPKYQWLPT